MGWQLICISFLQQFLDRYRLFLQDWVTTYSGFLTKGEQQFKFLPEITIAGKAMLQYMRAHFYSEASLLFLEKFYFPKEI